MKYESETRIELGNLCIEHKKIKERLAIVDKRIDILNSITFIKDNKITKDQVQVSDSKGMPWFGRISKFGDWLNMYSDKPWCCWNGTLYKTSEIIDGYMKHNNKGRYRDL